MGSATPARGIRSGRLGLRRGLDAYVAERAGSVIFDMVAKPTGDDAGVLIAMAAVVNATILPVLFISNVFIQMENAPDWLDAFSHVLPVRHFADAMIELYARGADAGVPALEVGVIALWGVIGGLAALRFFSWEPRR